jgi:hypothetical protein
LRQLVKAGLAQEPAKRRYPLFVRQGLPLGIYEISHRPKFMQKKWFSVQARTHDSVEHGRPHAEPNHAGHDRHWNAKDGQTENCAR